MNCSAPNKKQSDRQWLPIGCVGRANGPHGHFFLVPLNSAFGAQYLSPAMQLSIGAHPEFGIPAKLKEWHDSPNEGLSLEINILRSDQDVLQFENEIVSVAKDELSLDEKNASSFELVGCRVFHKAAEDPVGTVISTQNFGAGDILLIRGPLGEIALPAIEEYFDTSLARSEQKIWLIKPLEDIAELWEVIT